MSYNVWTHIWTSRANCIASCHFYTNILICSSWEFWTMDCMPWTIFTLHVLRVWWKVVLGQRLAVADSLFGRIHLLDSCSGSAWLVKLIISWYILFRGFVVRWNDQISIRNAHNNVGGHIGSLSLGICTLIIRRRWTTTACINIYAPRQDPLNKFINIKKWDSDSVFY